MFITLPESIGAETDTSASSIIVIEHNLHSNQTIVHRSSSTWFEFGVAESASEIHQEALEAHTAE